MAARDSILLLGRGELARDVAKALASTGSGQRVSLVMLGGGAGASGGESRLDPASSSCSRELADIVGEVRPATLVVLAFSESPRTPPSPWNADAALADLVTAAFDRALLHGARAPALIFLTSTAVYGVAPGSPLVFDERSSLPRETVFASAAERWAQGLRDVERALVRWAVGHDSAVGVLRCASVLGGPMDSPLRALLASGFPLRVLGYDPPCQALHYLDLVDAIVLAARQGLTEVLNLVGRETLPLSRWFAMAGVFAPPLPGPVADRLAPSAFDAAQLRWRTLADGSRATAVLGFRPQHSLEESLRAPNAVR